MIKIPKTVIISAISILFLSSCNQVINDTYPTTISATPTSSVNDIELTRKCLTTTLLSDHLVRGTVVYTYGAWQTALFELSNGKDYRLGTTFPIMAVSPDYQFLAYTTDDPPLLHIVNNFGDPIQSISIPEDWMGVIQWIDDDNVLIERFIDSPYFEASSILYNLKTGSQKEFLPDFPSFQAFMYPPDWVNFSYSRMVFNTQFTQVIYPQQIDEEYIMLMDVTDRLPILQIKGFHPTGAPQWSHDGTFFVIDLFPDAVYNEHQGINWPYTSGKDLFRISQDGDIQRLTYFTDQYYAKELMYSLSPDERYVAFWLSLSGDISDPSLSSELSVLDLVTGEVTNLCLMTSGAAIQPIWSPDGNYIIANVNDESNIVLVDWKNGLVSNILLVDGIAQAWMDSN